MYQILFFSNKWDHLCLSFTHWVIVKLQQYFVFSYILLWCVRAGLCKLILRLTVNGKTLYLLAGADILCDTNTIQWDALCDTGQQAVVTPCLCASLPGTVWLAGGSIHYFKVFLVCCGRQFSRTSISCRHTYIDKYIGTELLRIKLLANVTSAIL